MLDQPAARFPISQRTNPERSFTAEVRALRLGDGEIFRGEGIMAEPARDSFSKTLPAIAHATGPLRQPAE